MPGSQEFCAHPDFPLSVHVRVTEAGGTNVIDDVITRAGCSGRVGMLALLREDNRLT